MNDATEDTSDLRRIEAYEHASFMFRRNVMWKPIHAEIAMGAAQCEIVYVCVGATMQQLWRDGVFSVCAPLMDVVVQVKNASARPADVMVMIRGLVVKEAKAKKAKSEDDPLTPLVRAKLAWNKMSLGNIARPANADEAVKCLLPFFEEAMQETAEQRQRATQYEQAWQEERGTADKLLAERNEARALLSEIVESAHEAEDAGVQEKLATWRKES